MASYDFTSTLSPLDFELLSKDLLEAELGIRLENFREGRDRGIDLRYHNKPRFYYYDDFLGQTAQADKLNKNEDQKLLDFMCSIRDSKDSVLVLTTREYILNQAKLHYEKLDRENFDHRTCVIDLSKYSRRIRAQILYNHLHFSDLPRQHLEYFVANKGYVKIVDHANYNPRLVEYLTSAAWVALALREQPWAIIFGPFRLHPISARQVSAFELVSIREIRVKVSLSAH